LNVAEKRKQISVTLKEENNMREKDTVCVFASQRRETVYFFFINLNSAITFQILSSTSGNYLSV